MSMDKKQAALQAAAKYSTNPIAAFVEYGKLTEQIDSLLTFDKSKEGQRNTIDKLKQQMLRLLPKYRHPTNELAEYMIFLGHPDGPEIYSEGHGDPEFLVRMKKENSAMDLIKAVEKYVKEAELVKIELAECKDELDEFKDDLEKVIRIYDENRHKTSSARNTLVIQALGLSTGNTPRRLNKKKVYKHYLSLVRKKGMPLFKAVKIIAKLHDSTPNTVIRVLHDYRRCVKNKWKQEDPQNLPTVEKWLKGFVPPNR